MEGVIQIKDFRITYDLIEDTDDIMCCLFKILPDNTIKYIGEMSNRKEQL